MRSSGGWLIASKDSSRLGRRSCPTKSGRYPAGGLGSKKGTRCEGACCGTRAGTEGAGQDGKPKPERTTSSTDALKSGPAWPLPLLRRWCHCCERRVLRYLMQLM